MKSKYVLTGLWDNRKVYYVKTLINNYYGMPVRQLSETIEGAKIFRNKKSASKELIKMNDPILKLSPICPLCKKDYNGYPALSRKDNNTEICPECGIKEALTEFIKYKKTISR